MSKRKKKPLDVLSKAIGDFVDDVGSQIIEEGVAFAHELMHKTTGPDPYAVLGAKPTDSTDVVRSIYHNLAKYWHPDNPITGDAERFKEIQNAYETIIAARRNGQQPA